MKNTIRHVLVIAAAGASIPVCAQQPQTDIGAPSSPPRVAELQASEGRGESSEYAQAQQTQATGNYRETEGGRKKSSSTLEEIIVTAQKRSERLIDVPLSISVVSADVLESRGALQMRDIASAVPGLILNSAGTGVTQFSLRGVSTGIGLVATVGIYVDDVPYGSSSAFANGATNTLDAAFFDLDQIEVLKGPQGTLYGASTMGGLVKYVTKRPDANNFSGNAQVGVSNTRNGDVSYNAASTINVPLAAEKVALRVTGYYSRDGGYIDNVALNERSVNRADVYGARTDLLFTPTDAFSVRVAGFWQEVTRDGAAVADYTHDGETPYGDLGQSRALAEPFDQQFRLVSATVNYDFKWAMLTSVSGYQTVRAKKIGDLSTAYVPLLNSIGFGPYSAVGYGGPFGTDKFSQEIRLTGDANQRFEWVIGGFYTDEDSAREKEEFILRDLAGQPAPNNLLTFSALSTYEESAVFGDVTWHLTEKFDVTGGLRYARNQQKFEQIMSGVFGSSTPRKPSEENVSTYLGNVRYHFNDRATGYLRIATGYRPGGPNFVGNDPVTGLPIGPPTYKSDSLKSYEVGFKAQALDGRLGLDVAGYHIDWEDILIGASRGGFGVIANASGSAQVRGIDLNVIGRPSERFTLTGALAYTDAHMAEADPDMMAAEGERLPAVPRVSAALNADYELSNESLQPTFGATLRYVSDSTSGFGPGKYILPDYTTVDLRAGLTLGAVQARLYIRNVLDERAQLTVLNNFAGIVSPAILQPRTIGVTVVTSF